MRVLHIVPKLFGVRGIVGGAERYAYELARNMAAIVPTTLLSFGAEDYDARHGQLRVRVLGNSRHVRGQLTNPFSFRLFPAVLEADVVHCHQHHILASSVAALTSRLTGKRVFTTDLGGGGWDISGYVSTDRWFHGHLHISEYSRRVAGHNASSTAHVIWGGVDTQKFCDAGGPQKREFKVLFVGRVLPHKGIDDLIAAMPNNLPLEVIGEHYDKKYLAELLAMAVAKNVSFLSGCGDLRLVEAYRSASCIVLPSVYRDKYGNETKIPELLGQTLLEGMACGLPAICTDVASLPEVVLDGVTGFVVPPNDPVALRSKLMWLADHPLKACEMGIAGRERVLSEFTWERVVGRCLEIYG